MATTITINGTDQDVTDYFWTYDQIAEMTNTAAPVVTIKSPLEDTAYRLGAQESVTLIDGMTIDAQATS